MDPSILEHHEFDIAGSALVNWSNRHALLFAHGLVRRDVEGITELMGHED